MLTPQTELPLWMVQTFSSLRSKSFRTYFVSQLLSNCGSWIQLTVISWLVLGLTGSAFMLGLVNFLRLSPITVVGFLGGWLADSFDRKTILICTKIVMFLQATTLGLLTLSGNLEVWHVLVLATLIGIANAIDMPAKQSITFNLVPKEDLINAVSLNTSSFHASRAIGPVIAIVIVFCLGQNTGEGICILLNGISFLFVVFALSRIKLESKSSNKNEKNRSLWVGYKSSVEFVLNNRKVLDVFLLGATSSLLCMQYIVMMPVFAKTVLMKGLDGYGILMSAAAVGSFTGAMLLANKAKSGELLSSIIGVAAIGFAISLVIFSLSTNFVFSILIAVLIGLFSTTQLSSSNSLIQLEVDDELRGRVISLWMISVIGFGPVGGVVIGWFSNIYGAPITMACCGTLSLLLCSIVLSLKKLKNLQIQGSN